MSLMASAANALLPKAVLDQWRRWREYPEWARRGFTAPSPPSIKQQVLLRHNLREATWVETGTFLGDTTALLAAHARKVYSIEPEPTLFKKASARFRDHANVEILKGTSEEVLPTLMPRLDGNVCFWLDGHYSHGLTYRGPTDCPVIEELAAIEAHTDRLDAIHILIDDIRLFNRRQSLYRDYPTTDYLVDWARENGFEWMIEQDIFIASAQGISHAEGVGGGGLADRSRPLR